MRLHRTLTSPAVGFARLLTAVVFAGMLPWASAGSLTFYSTRAAFDAANPGLAVQTFDSAITGIGITGIDGPVNSATNDGVFKPGDILPGIAFDSHPPQGPGGQGLAAIPHGAFNFPPQAPALLGVNNDLNTFDILFAAGQKAVAFELFNSLSTATDNVIKVYGAGDVLLGQETVSTGGLSGAPAFFGVSSDTPITRVNQADPGTFVFGGVTNVEFSTSPQVVPEPGGLALTGVCLALLALRRHSRRFQRRFARVR
jgi:hypothetical protein